MSRMVRHEATVPFKIDPAQFPRDEHGNLKAIWICACGLSATMPYCDKAHKSCAGEEPGKVYEYDPMTRARREVTP